MVTRPFLNDVEVLLVEDSWGDILLMREAFEECDLPVHLNIVTDGEDALAYLNRESRHETSPEPDLILLDLNLPRMDGRALLRRIKRNRRFQTLPVVVLSSSKLETDVRETLAMDASDYLVKPIDLSGFRETAQRLWADWLRPLARPKGPGEAGG